jgi:hypothetical protein
MARLISAFLFLVLIPMAASTAWCEEGYLTNLELVEAAARVALDTVGVRTPPVPGSDLEVVVEEGHAGAWLVKKILNERMIELGWDIRVPSQGADSVRSGSTPYAVEVKVVQLNLVYGRQWRRYLIGSKMIERVARASFYLELVDRVNGDIMQTKKVRGEVRDVVPVSALGVLRDPKYAFASPELEKGNTDKYLEGGLVLAIIGVLVYLFYSNKTAS